MSSESNSITEFQFIIGKSDISSTKVCVGVMSKVTKRVFFQEITKGPQPTSILAWQLPIACVTIKQYMLLVKTFL